MCILVGFEVVKSRADSLSWPWLQHHLASPHPYPPAAEQPTFMNSGFLSLEILKLLRMQTVSSQTQAAHAAEPSTVAIECWFRLVGCTFLEFEIWHQNCWWTGRWCHQKAVWWAVSLRLGNRVCRILGLMWVCDGSAFEGRKSQAPPLWEKTCRFNVIWTMSCSRYISMFYPD